MMQDAFNFDSIESTSANGALMVREAGGTYRVATLEEIMSAARSAADARYTRGTNFTSPDAASAFFTARLGGYEHEVFAVAFLDTRHRLIACEEMFRGTIDRCSIEAREVVKAALRHNAATVVLCHNHPSGEVEPSAADRAITARLKQALALVDVRLLDHIVVAGSASRSMAAMGWV